MIPHLLVLASLGITSVCLADNDTVPIKSKGSARIVDKKKESGLAEKKSAAPAEEGPVEAAPALDSPEGTVPKPYVASIDTYGSPRIDEVKLKELLGNDLNIWVAKGLKGDPKSPEMQKAFTDKVKKKYGFALVEWSIVQYFEPGDFPIHITCDVVEKQDVPTRMPFGAPPTKELNDPDGLIKAWKEYEDTALELVETGALEPESQTCVAYHCPFGHKHPKLKKYETTFVNGVKKHEKLLLDIQANDKRPEFRAAATYLLAYLKDGKQVVQAMVGRVKDPDPVVRNNALRVLGDVAEFHPEFLIPVKPILEALDFPMVSDRTKSLYVAYLLSLNSKVAREEINKSALPILLKLMETKQPDQRELSHSILRKVSGQEFANTDVQAWKNWYNRFQKERGVSGK